MGVITYKRTTCDRCERVITEEMDDSPPTPALDHAALRFQYGKDVLEYGILCPRCASRCETLFTAVASGRREK